MSDEMKSEWNRHESHYASSWLTAMKTRMKYRKTPDIADDVIDELRKCVETSDAAAKDLHLIISALATDGIVISRDDEARKNLAECCGDIPGVGDIVWVSPEDEAELMKWLEQGAPDKPEWTLARA